MDIFTDDVVPVLAWTSDSKNLDLYYSSQSKTKIMIMVSLGHGYQMVQI